MHERSAATKAEASSAGNRFERPVPLAPFAGVTAMVCLAVAVMALSRPAAISLFSPDPTRLPPSLDAFVEYARLGAARRSWLARSLWRW